MITGLWNLLSNCNRRARGVNKGKGPVPTLTGRKPGCLGNEDVHTGKFMLLLFNLRSWCLFRATFIRSLKEYAAPWEDPFTNFPPTYFFDNANISATDDNSIQRVAPTNWNMKSKATLSSQKTKSWLMKRPIFVQITLTNVENRHNFFNSLVY